MEIKSLPLETRLIYLKTCLEEFKFTSALEGAENLAKEKQIAESMLLGIVALSQAFSDCGSFEGVMGDLIRYIVTKMSDDIDLLLFRSEITLRKGMNVQP